LYMSPLNDSPNLTVVTFSSLLPAQIFCSSAPPSEKVSALRKACKGHTELTRECSKGLGQDRHLYALYCLLQREINGDNSSAASSPTGETADDDKARSTSTGTTAKTNGQQARVSPELFTDPGWSVLNTSILSTSNCGNPALRLFGFGPVAPDGFGIGYIIKDDGVSIVAASKHLQTRRFLDTLGAVFTELQRAIKVLYLEANRPMRYGAHSEATGEDDTLIEEDEELKAAEVSLIGLLSAVRLLGALTDSLGVPFLIAGVA
jgi:carnitine O-acetyltransferase